MTKNQTPKTSKLAISDGRQMIAQDGLQLEALGAQMRARSDGLQMVAKPLNVNANDYGRQTSAQAVPQTAFTPAKGPKIPPMKNK